MDSFLHNIYTKCVLMDCISWNGNIFYASSLDSAQVCKERGRKGGREGGGRVSVQEHITEESRELQLENNENHLSLRWCVHWLKRGGAGDHCGCMSESRLGQQTFLQRDAFQEEAYLEGALEREKSKASASSTKSLSIIKNCYCLHFCSFPDLECV